MEAREKWDKALKLSLLTFLLPAFYIQGQPLLHSWPSDRKPCVYFEGTHIAKEFLAVAPGPCSERSSVEIFRMLNRLIKQTLSLLLKPWIHAFLTSHFDNWNSDSPRHNTSINFNTPRHSGEHITPVLHNLHQLPVPQQIHFKLLFFTDQLTRQLANLIQTLRSDLFVYFKVFWYPAIHPSSFTLLFLFRVTGTTGVYPSYLRTNARWHPGWVANQGHIHSHIHA